MSGFTALAKVILVLLLIVVVCVAALAWFRRRRSVAGGGTAEASSGESSDESDAGEYLGGADRPTPTHRLTKSRDGSFPHGHTAVLDDKKNGASTFRYGHRHEVVKGKVQPAAIPGRPGEPAGAEHTHELEAYVPYTHILLPAGGAGHSHMVTLDAKSNGVSTTDAGHDHQVKKGVVEPATAEGETTPHTHELALFAYEDRRRGRARKGAPRGEAGKGRAPRRPRTGGFDWW